MLIFGHSYVKVQELWKGWLISLCVYKYDARFIRGTSTDLSDIGFTECGDLKC